MAEVKDSPKSAVEEITFDDGQEEVETDWRSKWRIVDIILNVLMALLFVLIVYRPWADALGKMLWTLSILLLFLIYPLVSYILVFMISVVIYACLSMSGKDAAAHNLIYFYSWLKNLIEGAILVICCMEALRGLILNQTITSVYLQVYFV